LHDRRRAGDNWNIAAAVDELERQVSRSVHHACTVGDTQHLDWAVPKDDLLIFER